MKKYYVLAFVSIILFASLSSCINGNYSLDDVSKDGALSHDDGIYIPLGSFDTIRFETIELSIPVEVTFIKTVEGLFSEDLYKNFVIPNKDIDEALGNVTFSGNFLSGIVNPALKEFSDFRLSAQILKKDGSDLGIHIADQTFRVAVTEEQPFGLTIAKEDVPKLKEANALRFIFAFSSKAIEKRDYILISNVKLELSGGIRINWE
jgi:hypothetical protein